MRAIFLFKFIIQWIYINDKLFRELRTKLYKYNINLELILYIKYLLHFTKLSGLQSVLERTFSEANGRLFLVKSSPLIVC